jgi:hypothetical protein
MVQYLQFVLRRDLASVWGLFFGKTSEVDLKEETKKPDWREKAGENWYY